MLAENLRRVREEKGVSLEELADYTGLTKQAVWKYEHGRTIPNAIVMADIAKFLGVTCEDIVYGDSNADKRLTRAKVSRRRLHRN